MNQISERAFVFASRMKARNESESTIRTVLSEFDLSEAELVFVLKEAEQVSPFRVEALKPQMNPLKRAKNTIKNLMSLVVTA